ncbi:MAG: hypothetical protein AB1638_01555 [Nitrospirota bacterium]
MKKAFILLTLLALLLSALGGCGGGGGADPADVPSGENPGTPSVVRLLPDQFIAQTNSSITLHTKVLDGNGIPVSDISVTYTNLSATGILSSTTAKTNSNGLATVTIFSTTSGFATIQAEVNKGSSNVRDRKTVFFSAYDIAQLLPTLTLDVDGNNNGIFDEPSDFILFENTDDNTVLVRATVSNAAALIGGSDVTFGADRPYKVGSDPDAKCSDDSDTCDVIFPAGNSAVTNDFGQASVRITVVPSSITPISTTLNITAVADVGACNIVTLFLEPVTINTVSVFANPQTVDSGDTSSISANVTTTAGTPAPDGTTVNFRTTGSGGITPFAQTANGIAEATYTAPTLDEGAPNQTATITASAGGKSGSVLVTVVAPPPPPPEPPAELNVTPPNATVPEGGAATFKITGGVAPYTVASSHPTITLINGSTPPITLSAATTFTVTNSHTCGADVTVVITVSDSASTTKTANYVIDCP